MIADSAFFDVGAVKEAMNADVLSLVTLSQSAQESISWLAARGMAGPEELEFVSAHYANRSKYSDSIEVLNEIDVMQPSPPEATACERSMLRARLLSQQGAFDDAVKLVQRWEATSVGFQLSCAERLQAIRCQTLIERAAQTHVPLWTDVLGWCKGVLKSNTDVATVALIAAAISWPKTSTGMADFREWQYEAVLAAHGLPTVDSIEVTITALENMTRVKNCTNLNGDVTVDLAQKLGASSALSDAQRKRLRRLRDQPSSLCE